MLTEILSDALFLYKLQNSCRPSVAEAVAEALVAVRTEVTVDILLTFSGKFVDTAGIFYPFHIEILKEGGGSLVKHRTVSFLETRSKIHQIICVKRKRVDR